MSIYSSLAPKDPPSLFTKEQLSLSSGSNAHTGWRNHWTLEAAHQLPTYYTIRTPQVVVTARVPPPVCKHGRSRVRITTQTYNDITIPS